MTVFLSILTGWTDATRYRIKGLDPRPMLHRREPILGQSAPFAGPDKGWKIGYLAPVKQNDNSA